jgi:Na+/proline symporter
VFANLDGLETCVMSMLMIVIPTLVLMEDNVLMMLMTTAVSVNKDSQPSVANTPLTIVIQIPARMADPAPVRFFNKQFQINLF